MYQIRPFLYSLLVSTYNLVIYLLKESCGSISWLTHLVDLQLVPAPEPGGEAGLWAGEGRVDVALHSSSPHLRSALGHQTRANQFKLVLLWAHLCLGRKIDFNINLNLTVCTAQYLQSWARNNLLASRQRQSDNVIELQSQAQIWKMLTPRCLNVEATTNVYIRHN